MGSDSTWVWEKTIRCIDELSDSLNRLQSQFCRRSSSFEREYKEAFEAFKEKVQLITKLMEWKLFLCMLKVEQSPPHSMQNALSPPMNALVGGKLFKQVDIDVKVVVAACIREITKIAALDAPYNDDQMKEIFKLIVSMIS